MPEWFAQPDTPEQGQGLRFRCTLCGHCCSGSPGFVLVSDQECAAIARRLGITQSDFHARYTHIMSRGRSLNDLPERGYDCVFLDRTSTPGKATCGIYQDRPRQCRTWPFWPTVLASESTWERAGRSCPGINTGPIHPLVQVRIARDTLDL